MAPSAPDHQEVTRLKRELEAASRISQALFQLTEVDELVETALRTALDEVDAQAGSVLLADPESQQLIFQYSIGEKPVPRGTGLPWDKGIAGSVFQSGEPAITSRSRDNFPNPVTSRSNPYVPLNSPAIGDMFDLFNFDGDGND